MKKTLCLLTMLLLLPSLAAAGTHYYVDNTNPTSNDGNQGTNANFPWQTLGKAAKWMVAGDTVTVNGGSYNERITPSFSGKPGSPITFAVGPGKKPKVRGFTLTGKNYITVVGFELTSVGFSPDTEASIVTTGSIGVQILNNYIHDTTSMVAAIRSATNGPKSINLRIAGNTITGIGLYGSRANAIQVWGDGTLVESNDISHSQDFADLYGNHIVVRGNNMHDAYLAETPGHIDGFQSFCSGGTPNEAVNYLLLEGNYFHDVPDDNQHFALINGTAACGGTTTVVLRENVIYNVGTISYSMDEIGAGDHHKYYNNTTVNGEIAFSPKRGHATVGLSGSTFGSVMNNIFVDAVAPSAPAQVYQLDLSGTSSGDYNLAFMTAGPFTWSSPINSEAHHVLNKNPLFAGPSDFHLQANSPARGAGGPLTQVDGIDAGNGLTLVVLDAHFFQDGWAGAFPDSIAVGNNGNSAQISSINYKTNTITLTKPLVRKAGDAVWLSRDSRGLSVLNSSAPDLGANPYFPTSASTLRPPGNQ